MDDGDVSLHTDGDCQVDAAGESNLGQGQEDRDEVGVPVFSSYTARLDSDVKSFFEGNYIAIFYVLTQRILLGVRTTVSPWRCRESRRLPSSASNGGNMPEISGKTSPSRERSPPIRCSQKQSSSYQQKLLHFTLQNIFQISYQTNSLCNILERSEVFLHY